MQQAGNARELLDKLHDREEVLWMASFLSGLGGKQFVGGWGSGNLAENRDGAVEVALLLVGKRAQGVRGGVARLQLDGAVEGLDGGV